MPTAVSGTADAGGWVGRYLRNAMVLDAAVALAAGLIALRGRYDSHGHVPAAYIVLTVSLPVIWLGTLALAGAYEPRFIGAGADEFRRVINAGLGLTSAIAILSYATRAEVSRSYVLIAMPCAVGIDLVARYALRKRLHRLRDSGGCMRRAVAVGHPQAVADLVNELRREPYHGLTVIAACLAGAALRPDEIAGVPVLGGLDDVISAVRGSDADTVAVLACPELKPVQLRQLAWELEKTDTDLCLAPALLDVAGPRTSVRAAAGLPLLYVDHPDLSGLRQVIKGLFDKVAAASALLLLAPLMLTIALMIRLEDGGPALFKQVRVGKDGPSGCTSSAPWCPRPSSRRRRCNCTTRRQASCSRSGTTRGSPRSGAGFAAGPSTSCPSSSTCCSGICRWWDRAPRCRKRRPSTATTCGAGWPCGPG